jgi:hypothetical protein
MPLLFDLRFVFITDETEKEELKDILRDDKAFKEIVEFCIVQADKENSEA